MRNNTYSRHIGLKVIKWIGNNPYFYTPGGFSPDPDEAMIFKTLDAAKNMAAQVDGQVMEGGSHRECATCEG